MQNNLPKSLFALIAAGIVLVTGLGAYIFFSDTSSVPSGQNTPQTNTTESMEKVTPVRQAYGFYTPEVFEGAKNGRRVLFFFAAWCPTCKAADAEFQANLDKIPQDVSVIKVHYNDTQTDDAGKELAKKYGITYQHTFVQIDSEGKEITKWNGGDINELLTNVK